MKRITLFFVALTFMMSCILPPQGFAQTLSAVEMMPPPGELVSLTSAYSPATLWGMTINPNDPFQFDFLVYRGDENLSMEQK